MSLGFDAHWGDRLTDLHLSLWGGFRPLLDSAVALADELCGGRLVVCLEDGYYLPALAHGRELVCRVVAGQTVTPDRWDRRTADSVSLLLRPSFVTWSGCTVSEPHASSHAAQALEKRALQEEVYAQDAEILVSEARQPG